MFTRLLSENRPLIMGILNVTPDSFSDGGQFLNPERAIEQGLQLIEDGADIIDIGGESTRPGAETVSPEEEIRRVIPVIEGLNAHAPLISIDTRNAATMRAAMIAGAHVINDVSALTHDPASLDAAHQTDAYVVLMHSQGTPQDMQNNPRYDDVVAEIKMFFEARIAACVQVGIDPDRIILDPGIGFGKALEHNIEILRNLSVFQSLGHHVLLGTSRKSFISHLCGECPPDERLGGSLASALWGVLQGVKILRVHDVAEMRQALDVYTSISECCNLP